MNLDELWNFRDPAESERRFREALDGATPDDALILQTQIARTYGLRSQFETAERLLAEIAGEVAAAGSAELTTRHHLETGRALVSATRPASDDEPQRTERARRHYAAALETAEEARLDGLAIDAVHMMAFIDTEPAAQLEWAQRGLAIAAESQQPAARRWEASLRHNAGYALHQMGEYEAALTEFEQALALRREQGTRWPLHVARWMVAWTLRHLERYEEALAIQLELKDERDQAGEPDRYVDEEIALLRRALS